MKKIAVTGACGQISYSLVFRLANGDVFSNDPIELSLLDVPGMEKTLEGLAMELEDCAFPLLKKIRIGTNPREQFKDIDFALLIGARPREKGMERSDLLMENARIFVEQGRALNDSANKDALVFVVGNPCNTNCLIALKHAPRLNPRNFHAMMRLDQNRASSLLAKKAMVGVEDVSHLTIWGNHSATQVPDFVNARILDKNAMNVIQDHKWLQTEFVEKVQKRGAQILEARGKSSAASAASSLIDAMKSLCSKNLKEPIFSSAVLSDGNPYGIEPGLVFGFPCRSIGNNDYEIIPNLQWDFFIKEKIAVTQRELLAERDCIIDSN